MNLTVQIGGYTVHIHEPGNHPCLAWPLRPFEYLLASPISSPDIRADVPIVVSLTFNLLAEGTMS